MTSGWDGSGTVGRRRIQTCPPGPPLLDWLPGTTRELTSNLYLTAETTMSEASGKFWVKVYFFNVSDCCSSFNLNTIICIFFLSWLSLFEQQLFSGKWEQPPPTSKNRPPFEKSQITRWRLGSLHPPVVILVNMMTRCGGYCSISAHPPAGPHYMWIIYWILSSFPPKLISPEKRAATAAATTTTAAAFPFP